MGDALRTLAGQLRGELLLPDDHGYEAARRGYNSLHDHRPAVIVRPADGDDVARALEFATSAGLEIAVRSGGHSLAGYGATEGGALIDLSAMYAIHIDATARVASVEAGTTAGQLTATTAAHGLVVPFGDSPTVGVGGITLGGGVGWLSRKLGLTIDSLDSVEVVTAEGQLVAADEHTRQDLFWAVRGGGGNFGVVTRFRYRLHPIGTVLGGALVLPATHEVIRGVIDLADAAPDELTTISLITRLPPLSIVPPEMHGQLAVLITLVWCGEVDEGARFVNTFRTLAPPIADLLHPRPYPSMYELIPEAPQSVTNITYSFAADALDDVAIGSILHHMEDSNLPSTEAFAAVELRCLGGRSAGFRLTLPPLPIASGDCSAPSSWPGSLRLTPTVTAGGCSPWRARSGTSPRGRTSTSSTLRTKLAFTRPIRTARIVVSSRSSGAMTRQTFSIATSTSDPTSVCASGCAGGASRR